MHRRSFAHLLAGLLPNAWFARADACGSENPSQIESVSRGIAPGAGPGGDRSAADPEILVPTFWPLPPDSPTDGLYPDRTPESFVLHSGVQAAYAAVVQAAGHPDEKGRLYCVYGDRRLGKSHLMHAAGHLIKAARPGATVLRLSAMSFPTDVAEAAESGGSDALMRRFCGLEALLLVDIELLADDQPAQEALVAVFDDLLARGRQGVITSNRHPEEIRWLVPALVPPTASGVPARIDPPDPKGRVAIRRRIGAECGVEMLPDAVAYFIARLPLEGGSVRELEHCLRRVLANAEFEGQPVSLSLAKEVLRPTGVCPRFGHRPASWTQP